MFIPRQGQRSGSSSILVAAVPSITPRLVVQIGRQRSSAVTCIGLGGRRVHARLLLKKRKAIRRGGQGGGPLYRGVGDSGFLRGRPLGRLRAGARRSLPVQAGCVFFRRFSAGASAVIRCSFLYSDAAAWRLRTSSYGRRRPLPTHSFGEFLLQDAWCSRRIKSNKIIQTGQSPDQTTQQLAQSARRRSVFRNGTRHERRGNSSPDFNRVGIRAGQALPAVFVGLFCQRGLMLCLGLAPTGGLVVRRPALVFLLDGSAATIQKEVWTGSLPMHPKTGRYAAHGIHQSVCEMRRIPDSSCFGSWYLSRRRFTKALLRWCVST